MNCPSRNDPEVLEHSDYNQNPHPLALETNSDMNGLANRRLQRDHRLQEEQQLDDRIGPIQLSNLDGASGASTRRRSQVADTKKMVEEDVESLRSWGTHHSEGNPGGNGGGKKSRVAILVDRARALQRTFVKFGSFVGPGFMVAVAYIDPGMYSVRDDFAAQILTSQAIMRRMLQRELPTDFSFYVLFCSPTSLPSFFNRLVSSSVRLLE